jgi:glutamyl-tRNA synthetase
MRLRFAPAPTGELHLGGARTALFNWLFARKEGGEFFLRFEDTDIERNLPEVIENIKEALLWLNLNWDSSPIFQSERLSIYREYALKLLKDKKAYLCFCSSEELEKERKEAKMKNIPYKYSRKCYYLSSQEKAHLERVRTPAIRFKVPEDINIKIYDLIRGELNFDSSLLGDFIILRPDGRPTYNFACVVDDHLLEITHILRGEDHISNTPRQLLIYYALGIDKIPNFGHLPLILDKDRQPLSKRRGALSILEYCNLGYLSSAIVNYLALLGFSTPDSQQLFFSLEELKDKFSLDRVSKAAAIFDKDKLDWINREHIRHLKTEELAQKITKFLKKRPLVALDKLLSLYRERISSLVCLEETLPYLFDEEIEYTPPANEILENSETKGNLAAAYSVLESLEEFTPEKIEGSIRNLAVMKGIRAKELIHPLRAAVTGTTVGPSLFELLALFPKEVVLKRIKKVIESEKYDKIV